MRTVGQAKPLIRKPKTRLDAAMTDEEYLETQRRWRAESVELFRAENKPKRERWVVREFLTNLGVRFTDDELVAVAQEPPDIQFCDAKFEIKEILDEGRRRHQEYKEGLEKALRATSPGDLVEMFTPEDVTVGEVFALILREATALAAEKYPPLVRKTLDLLFYVNLQDVFGLVETPFPDSTAMSSLGWRSVSFLMGYRGSALVAANDAPDFIKAAVGRIVHRQVGHEAASDL